MVPKEDFLSEGMSFCCFHLPQLEDVVTAHYSANFSLFLKKRRRRYNIAKKLLKNSDFDKVTCYHSLSQR